MQTKLFEVRDRATCMVALATRLTSEDPREATLLRRAGYYGDGPEAVAIAFINDGATGRSTTDPFAWGDRTRRTAHEFITDHWDALQSGDVVDVEYVLGETDAPKREAQWR